MDFWRQIIETLGGIGIAAAALSWLTKSIVTQWLSKDIEYYKSSLSLESMRQIEEFKTQIQQAATENSIRFSKLHEKRIKIIAELYYLIENTESTMRLFVLEAEMHSDGTLQEDDFQRGERHANQVINSLIEFFRHNKLYLDAELSHIIEEILYAMYDPFIGYMADEMKVQSGDASHVSSLSMKFKEDWAEREKYFNEAKARMEKDFRQILGSTVSKR